MSGVEPRSSAQEVADPAKSLVDGELLRVGIPGGVQSVVAHGIYERLISMWATGVIEAAQGIGVFEGLVHGSATGEVLADRLGSDQRVTRVLCDALAVYGILDRHGAEFAVSKEVAECFLEGGLYSLAGKVRHDREVAWNAWRDLAETARRGTLDANGTERANEISDADYEHLAGGINFWAPPIVELLTTWLVARGWAASESYTIADVGCGTGIYSQLLLSEFPGALARGLDVKRVVPIAEAQAQRLGVAERFQALACDFFTDPWPAASDLVLLGNIFHLQDDHSARVLLHRAAAAVARDGVLCIVDHIVDRDGPLTSPQDRFALLFAASMAATGGGDAHALAEYDEWLDEAGLRRIGLIDAPMHRILIATLV